MSPAAATAKPAVTHSHSAWCRGLPEFARAARQPKYTAAHTAARVHKARSRAPLRHVGKHGFGDRADRCCDASHDRPRRARHCHRTQLIARPPAMHRRDAGSVSSRRFPPRDGSTLLRWARLAASFESACAAKTPFRRGSPGRRVARAPRCRVAASCLVVPVKPRAAGPRVAASSRRAPDGSQ